MRRVGGRNACACAWPLIMAVVVLVMVAMAACRVEAAEVETETEQTSRLRASVRDALLSSAAVSASETVALVTNTTAPTPTPNAAPWWNPPCCNSAQTSTLVVTSVYIVLIALLWHYSVLLPLKLIVIVLHEASHAIATWLTCGSVSSIEVHSNEGGVTMSRGGNRFIILSAGYLGSAVWGAGMIVSTSDIIAVQVVAGLLAIVLLLSLFFANNMSLVALSIFFLLLLAGFWACTLLTVFNGLRFFVLLVGTMSSLYAVWDIWDDLLSRRVEESDASQLAKHTGTSSRCWGALWGLISVALFASSLYFCVVILADGQNVNVGNQPLVSVG